MTGCEEVREEPPPVVRVTALSKSSVSYAVRFWTQPRGSRRAQEAVLEGVRRQLTTGDLQLV